MTSKDWTVMQANVKRKSINQSRHQTACLTMMWDTNRKSVGKLLTRMKEIAMMTCNIWNKRQE